MKICVFTGTRAEYGLLLPLLNRIEQDPDTELQLLVSGSHLSDRHGHTVDAILADGFTIQATVPLQLNDDTRLGVATAMGEALTGCAHALDKIRPDILILLGDRYECFACATAASILGYPIAHIHGGEVTEGAMDDYYRHSITKMSHLHFTSCEAYRDRVIQLGEHPDTVFNVGALGVENIMTTPLMDKIELEADLNFSMGDNCLLTTYHPVTQDKNDKTQLNEFFSAIETLLSNDPTMTAIITGANADPGGNAIDERAALLANKHPRQTCVVPSLGLVRYLSAMKYCKAVIGNSSSGILEAPSFKIPSINVGIRQKGREQAKSVFNSPSVSEILVRRTRRALEAGQTRVVKEVLNPYEKEGTSLHILNEIKQAAFQVAKPFYDITHSLLAGEE